jgi:thiol-disulfide isomerase/thioredoxin
MKFTWIPLLALACGLAAPSLALSISTDDAPTLQERKDEKKSSDKKKDEKKRGKKKALEVGSTVDERVSLPDMNGKTTSFKDLRGKVVVLHFWSDRCPAERHANPVFARMEKKYAESKDVVMIGIASNQNELGKKPGADANYEKLYLNLREKLKDVGLRHKILIDHGNVISTLFGARSTPHCFVIDKKGVVQYAGALDDDQRGKKGDKATNYLVDATTAVLAGRKPEVTNTKPYG